MWPRLAHFAAAWFFLLLLLGAAAPLHAASPPAPNSAGAAPGTERPVRIQELLDLLADPEVQGWLKEQRAAKTAQPAGPPAAARSADLLSARLDAIRAHLAALVAIVPQLPAQFDRAGTTLATELEGRSFVGVLSLFLVFLGLGFGAGWLFYRATRRLRLYILALSTDSVGRRLIALLARLGYGVAFVAVFGVASLGAFLIFDWPPLLREILLEYLLALLALCIAVVFSRFFLAPGLPGTEDVDRFRVLPMSRPAARF